MSQRKVKMRRKISQAIRAGVDPQCLIPANCKNKKLIGLILVAK